MIKDKISNKAFWLFVLHILLLFYSSCGVFSKLASKEDFFSLNFIIFYIAEIFVLFVYAIVWQQVIKNLPLTVAFCNKSVGMIWSMLWGALLFHEVITINMIIGAGIVLVGILLVVTSNE